MSWLTVNICLFSFLIYLSHARWSFLGLKCEEQGKRWKICVWKTQQQHFIFHELKASPNKSFVAEQGKTKQGSTVVLCKLNITKWKRNQNIYNMCKFYTPISCLQVKQLVKWCLDKLKRPCKDFSQKFINKRNLKFSKETILYSIWKVDHMLL